MKSETIPFPPHHTFKHEAMMTTFYFRFCGDDLPLMKSLACECCYLIDDLERKLSRFREGSDISQINMMKKGDTLYLSEESHACLLTAMQASIYTGGLFDPTLGALIDHQKQNQTSPPPLPKGQLIVHPDTPAVTCESPGRIIDLGGIGKGFALDQLARFLSGWDIEGALLSSGASTHIAVGEQAWPMNLQGTSSLHQFPLINKSLSASGTHIQGSHIVHPQTESIQKNSTQTPSRIWATSSSAAFADAWSTALMLLSPDDYQNLPSPDIMLNSIYRETSDGFCHILPDSPPSENIPSHNRDS